MKVFLALSAIILGVNAATAVRVSPFVYEFDPTNDQQNEENKDVSKEKEFTYSITNKMNCTIAFDVAVYKRCTDKNGKETLIKDEDSFLVFPSQLIIKPQEERSVKLRWVGNKEFKKNPHKEQAFRVVIKQYKINLNPFKKQKRESTVEFTYQINASLYMTPGKSRSNVVVIKTETFKNGFSRVYVENRGTRHISYAQIKSAIKIPGYNGELNKVLLRNSREGSLQIGEAHEFVVDPTLKK